MTNLAQAGKSPEKLVVCCGTPIEAYVVYKVSRPSLVGGQPAVHQTLRHQAKMAINLMHSGMTTSRKHALVNLNFQDKPGSLH